MQNDGLDEAQAGIKIARGNINNLRYAADTTLMAESKEELKNPLMKVKEESEKVHLKLSIQKIKIMASGPITSWQIDGETMETRRNFILGALISLQIVTTAMKIKRRLLLGRKAMTNLESKVESLVTQSCPTLCDPMDYSLPGSSVHGIFQARVLKWVAISFSRGSSGPRDQTQVSHIVGRRFTVWAMTNLDSILKSRDIALPTKIHLVKAMVFPVVTYGCKS